MWRSKATTEADFHTLVQYNRKIKSFLKTHDAGVGMSIYEQINTQGEHVVYMHRYGPRGLEYKDKLVPVPIQLSLLYLRG